MKPSQVSENATTTSKLKFVNASTQTDGKIHVGCHDVPTLTENMFAECPERKDCDPDFLDDSFLSSENDDPLDESFKVDDLETSDDDDESQDEDEERISSSCKFITFREMLSQLLMFCFKCRKAAHTEKTKVRGSLLEVTLMCVEGHQTQWRSQPVTGTMALGNMLIAASILFTGNTFTRIKEFCDVLSLSTAKMSSFLKIQKKYLFPVINHFYIKQRNKIVSELKTHTALNVIGDGRCDSPGFSAKY